MMAYRVNLLFFVLSNLAYSISGILFVYFLFQSGQVENIAGFSLYEFYFVMAIAQLVQMIGWMVAGKSTWRLRQAIYFGELDFSMIKPANIVFLNTFNQFWIAQLGSTLVSSGFLLWVSWPKLSIDWPAELMIKFFIILLISIVVFWLLFWLASLVWFFWPKFNGLRILFDAVSDVSFYPKKIYPQFLSWFLSFVFPIFLVANPLFLLIKGGYDWSVMMRDCLIMVIFILIYLIMWKEGLKKYNSAN